MSCNFISMRGHWCSNCAGYCEALLIRLLIFRITMRRCASTLWQTSPRSCASLEIVLHAPCMPVVPSLNEPMITLCDEANEVMGWLMHGMAYSDGLQALTMKTSLVEKLCISLEDCLFCSASGSPPTTLPRRLTEDDHEAVISLNTFLQNLHNYGSQDNAYFRHHVLHESTVVSGDGKGVIAPCSRSDGWMATHPPRLLA